ncbi:hypothetical protein ILUMI_19331 [Ignelater luminosus]|uniref:Uncharacterized protein n=1 Tax=Ignelater luminosus TaxID=2038154 RepID=A0A8K0G3B7_IGNLU|nr:hypothetical protein ILUMI_19331 [Ignelater luminosus]
MLNNELLSEDPVCYRNYLRMSSDSFENLLRSVENDIAKIDASCSEATEDCVAVLSEKRISNKLAFIKICTITQLESNKLKLCESIDIVYKFLQNETESTESKAKR